MHAHHSQLASRLSGGHNLKLKQEEVLFAMIRPSSCTSKAEAADFVLLLWGDEVMKGAVVRRRRQHLQILARLFTCMLHVPSIFFFRSQPLPSKVCPK